MSSWGRFLCFGALCAGLSFFSVEAGAQGVVTPVVFIPADETITPSQRHQIEAGLVEVQMWYASRLGDRRLQFAPLVVAHGSHNAAHYRDGAIWSEAPTEVAEEVGHPPWASGYVNLILGRGALGWAGGNGLVDRGRAVIGLESMIEPARCAGEWWCNAEMWIGTVIHELGHALTLPHSIEPSIMAFHGDFRNKTLLESSSYPERETVGSSIFSTPGSVGQLTQSIWRNNQGYYRTLPVLDGNPAWERASSWVGPVPPEVFPGSGAIESSNNFVAGNELIQSVWRGGLGYYRSIPISKGSVVWSSAGPWSSPISPNLLPGTGAVQASSAVIVGSQLTQSLWRDNQGYYRTVPIVNGQLQWSQAGAWVGPLSLNVIPGTGNIEATSSKAYGSTYLQSFWRGGSGYYRTVPIRNGVIVWGESSQWFGPLSTDGLPGSGAIQTTNTIVTQP